jgi:hypothetical protein
MTPASPSDESPASTGPDDGEESTPAEPDTDPADGPLTTTQIVVLVVLLLLSLAYFAVFVV